MILRLRSEFWILGFKSLVKQTIRKCRIRLFHKQQTQIMASIPPERGFLFRFLTNKGVDFKGPVNINIYSGRACSITKGYATKAIHLEPTSDLSTYTFFAAFSMWIIRRDCPSYIFSDNGIFFVGGVNLLKQDRLTFMRKFKITSLKILMWSLSRLGGFWEAGVKSFKLHLRQSMLRMNSILTKIEVCLNWR